MIETIERALGLQVDWRAHEHLRKLYSWLLELENIDLNLEKKIERIVELEDKVYELEHELGDSENRVEELEGILDANEIGY